MFILVQKLNNLIYWFPLFSNLAWISSEELKQASTFWWTVPSHWMMLSDKDCCHNAPINVALRKNVLTSLSVCFQADNPVCPVIDFDSAAEATSGKLLK